MFGTSVLSTRLGNLLEPSGCGQQLEHSQASDHNRQSIQHGAGADVGFSVRRELLFDGA